MARRRSYGYRTRTEYFTNNEGQEVMLKLINDIAKSDSLIKTNLSLIKTAEAKIKTLEKEENESSESKYSRMRIIHAATEQKIKDYFIINGHYVNNIDINSEYTHLELRNDRYSSRNRIKLSFGEYNFRNRNDIEYHEEISFDFDKLSVVESSRIFNLGNFIMTHLGDILEMMGDGYCEIDDIRNNVKSVNNTDEVRMLRNKVQEYYNIASECIHMSAIVNLATKKSSWFDKYISDGNKPHVRYAMIKGAKYRTDKRIDNFNQYTVKKAKYMLVNTETADFLEISKSKISNYVPVIMAGSTELTFGIEEIKTVLRTKYIN